jgi:putative RNA 2'-phosphotransferase
MALAVGTNFMADSNKSTSKFLSLVLRHEPERIGIVLDNHGWADISELLRKAADYGVALSMEYLNRIVAENDKQRFVLSEDGLRIRANQGHSVPVDLQLQKCVPPLKLFHGTALRNLLSIKERGLLKGERHHVHLSVDEETALKVGQRYGKPIIIAVFAKLMEEHGYDFYQSENGVWLTDWVPPAYLEL